jgi:hypothetical protein
MPTKKRGWWRGLPDDCPIPLESIASLPYPPFNLGTDESHATYFDGFVLANYLVSTGSFIHPISRRELPRQRLDGASTARQLDSQGSSLDLTVAVNR